MGHRCIGAKVNGKLLALELELHTGDRVEVFTSKDPDAGPSKDWESFVVSPRAKSKIRQWFAKERREVALEAGRDALAAEIQRGGLPMHRLFTPESMQTIAGQLSFNSVDQLYTAIGNNNITAGRVVNLLMEQFGGQEEAEDALAARTPLSQLRSKKNSRADSAGVLVEGDADYMAKLAKCCTPVPGDDIFGFVTRGGGVSVHRTDCTNAPKLKEEPERLISVSWAAERSGAVFTVTLQIEGLDRQGLLSDVTRAVSEQKVAILATNSHTAEDRVAVVRFTFEVSDVKQLGYLMTQLRNVEGVFDVFRVTSGG